jgi:putative heme iron utilization protein
MDTPKQDAMRRAKALLQAGGTASLGVVDLEGGAPFTTLVNFVVADDLSPVLLISSLAHHSKCLAQNNRASLLLHETIADGDPMLTFRVTLLGAFSKIPHDDIEPKFLARHPYAEMYSRFGDFHFWKMQAEHAHIIAGFGRAYGVRFKDVAGI